MAREKGFARLDHDQWAAAMVACQGYPPECAACDCCLLNGDCFQSDKRAMREARQKIDALIAAEPSPMVRVHLKAALDQMVA